MATPRPTPKWLKGPSIPRALCVTFGAMLIFGVTAYFGQHFESDLLLSFAWFAFFVGAVGVFDFWISAFTIYFNRKES
jgi:hypothetical protein